MKKFTLILFAFLSFLSFLNAQTTLLSEGFEGTTLFTVYDGDADGNAWSINSTTGWPHTGSNCIAVKYNVAGNNDYLISPSVNLPAGTNIIFSFYAKSVDPSYLESFEIRVTADGTNYNYITSETNISGIYTQFSYDLSSYAGQTIKIAIICISVDEYYLVVDDILCTSTGSSSIPTVTTNTATSITSTSATSGGNVTSDGGNTVIARGVCWSTSVIPYVTDNHTTDGSGVGSFTSSLTGLTSNTSYSYRAYATNNIGTAYGSLNSFTTSSFGLPIVTTTMVTSITSTTATSGGNVISDAGGTIVARGVCWSTCPHPYISQFTTDGTGTGIFTSYITGLKPNTTYYCRAYATNDNTIPLTGYGDDFVFTTRESIPSGPLDTTLGNTGIITTNFCYGDDFGHAMAIQLDGKIVVAGYAEVESGFDFGVVRYNTNGTLDYSFGTEGKITTNFNSDDRAYAIAIQPDEKILVVGTTGYGTYNFAMSRYFANGTLDNTFGNGGRVTTTIGAGYNVDEANCVAIQIDGKIVVSGYTSNSGNYKKFASVRYNSNGSIDNTFGNNGIIISTIGSANDIIYGIKIQSDGKIIVVGSSFQTYGENIAIVRYNTNGTFDNVFGNNGIALINAGIYPYSQQCKGYALDIQADGKIVVGGMNFNKFAVLRCNTDGSLDNSFGTGGIALTQVSSEGGEAYAIKIQSNGKIFLAGYANSGSLPDIALVRYNEDGTIDNYFGNNGIVVTHLSNSSDGAHALALQADGKIVIAGYSLGPENFNFTIVRYNNASIPLPGSAGTISGTTTVCQGQYAVIYTVPTISNATSYIWTLPSGANGTSTSNSITVNFGTGAVSGNITVKGHNSSGNGAVSTLAINVNPLPNNAGTITGLTTVCQGQNSVAYTVPTITNATSYVWTLPNGATGTSTTKNITVNYGTSAVSGNITVKGHNACGDGTESQLSIIVNNKPITPAINLNGYVLHSNAPLGNQWYNQLGIINGETNQEYNVIATGDYHVIVTLDGCSSNPSNILHVVYIGIGTNNNNSSIKIYPNPVSNELIIENEGNTKKTHFEILNSTGQIVYKGNFIEKTVVQTANFNNGVYLIKLSNGETFEFRKIVKE